MLNDNVFARVSDFEAMEAELTGIRRFLHANPELSCEEAETARFVAEKLESWGYEVTRNVGGHGVVASVFKVPVAFASCWTLIGHTPLSPGFNSQQDGYRVATPWYHGVLPRPRWAAVWIETINGACCENRG